jgi:hypothetical protein
MGPSLIGCFPPVSGTLHSEVRQIKPGASWTRGTVTDRAAPMPPADTGP